MDSQQLENKVTTVIEDIQEAIVQSGGNFIRQKDVRNMCLGELLKILIPNHIVIGIEYHAPDPEVKPSQALRSKKMEPVKYPLPYEQEQDEDDI